MPSKPLPYPAGSQPPTIAQYFQDLATATPVGELAHYEFGALSGNIVGETTFDSSAQTFNVPGPRVLLIHVAGIFTSLGAGTAGIVVYLAAGTGIPAKNGNYRVAHVTTSLPSSGTDETAAATRRVTVPSAGAYTIVFTLFSVNGTAKADGVTSPLELTVQDLGVPGP